MKLKEPVSRYENDYWLIDWLINYCFLSNEQYLMKGGRANQDNDSWLSLERYGAWKELGWYETFSLFVFAVVMMHLLFFGIFRRDILRAENFALSKNVTHNGPWSGFRY